MQKGLSVMDKGILLALLAVGVGCGVIWIRQCIERCLDSNGVEELLLLVAAMVIFTVLMITLVLGILFALS